MLESILFGFLVFAAAHAILVRIMARRADVLHGEYVQPDGLNRNDATRSWLATLQCNVDGVRRLHEASRRPFTETASFLCRVDWHGGDKLDI
jgi:hypothetical protein